MELYLNLLRKVLAQGEERIDRTGTGTRSIFGESLVFDLAKGFPLVTTKRVHVRSVIGELLWFLSGSTSVNDLHEMGVTIWDEWADKSGSLGPVYGHQWRSWPTADGKGTIDQIQGVIDKIHHQPHSRRILVTALNVAYCPDETISPQENVALGRMALPPCHMFFQFYVREHRFLDCLFFMRSCDCFLGLPFNIASYALLTHMVAQQTNLIAGSLKVFLGDTHIYNNHMNQVNEQLSREPFPLPSLEIKRKPASIFDYSLDDFSFENYQHHPAIRAPIAV